MPKMISRPAAGLTGRLSVPGDKSLSHRALMLGALSVGETRITGLLDGEDVLSTAGALRMLGADIDRGNDGTWSVHGRGVGGLTEPAGVLDMGNAGTGARLIMGILAGHPFNSTLTGDESLCARPMERVMSPLRPMGVAFEARTGGRLPVTVKGTDRLIPTRQVMTVASAQVKSAVLLAGLHARGQTTVIEPVATRDHTENLLAAFGAEIAREQTDEGLAITLTGQPELTARDVQVPGDVSSAAFPLIAALITKDSDVTVEGIGLNPLRTGLLDCLREMGADISIENPRELAGEPAGDLRAKGSSLAGITVPAERAASMIDEYPILAVAAACAEGDTVFEGVGELRVKESDRLSAIADGLTACGVSVEEEQDRLTIHGCDGPPPGGGAVEARLDHRIAMSFLVLGVAAEAPVSIDDGAMIETSFPGFAGLMNGLGAVLESDG